MLKSSTEKADRRTDLLRKWITLLRLTQVRQCKTVNRNGDAYSAMGLFYSLPDSDSRLLSVFERTMVHRMNDEGRNFKEIADFIEQNYLRVPGVNSSSGDNT